jgi:hypothetical protein
METYMYMYRVQCNFIFSASVSVFKVFSIDDDEFVERHNFRVGKNLNLTYSALDVAWNPVEGRLWKVIHITAVLHWYSIWPSFLHRDGNIWNGC